MHAVSEAVGDDDERPLTRGKSNLTKSASRGGAHSPVMGHTRGRKLYH